ncbi:MAG: SufD family Fe-S cluster assembly protein [Patescibacteria group bacterium]
MKNVIIKENETLVLPILWTGEESEISYEVLLSGQGASVAILGLLLGKDDAALQIKINVTHAAKNTKSEVILKGALTDAAKVNFEGLVKINHGATGTNAWLAAHLLLLSDKSKGRAIPSLEILENDIKAGHATTVGRINDIEMFYLMSRGLSREQAKQFVVQGFLASILEKFPREFQQKAKKNVRLS